MAHPIQSIVIVGGGTAGWLTAGIIAARHQGRMKAGFSVTLVESPNIKIIGVGEGTWPTLRSSLEKMGVSETEFFRHCDAAFKQGAKFARWTTGADNDGYYHPLMFPQGFTQLNLAPHWLRERPGTEFQRRGLSAGTALRRRAGAQDHHDARVQGGRQLRLSSGCGKVRAVPAEALHGETGRAPCARRRAKRQSSGKRRYQEPGHRSGRARSQAICSSTAPALPSLLLGKTLGVGFKDCSDVLFCDTALAVQVPYDTPDAPMASHTHLHRPVCGLDLGHRPADAPRHRLCLFQPPQQRGGRARNAAALHRRQAQGSGVRKIPIRAGHRETFWKNNCVAVGLAAGFLEPLESSAIVLVELSAKLIAEQMPANREVMDIVAARFNDVNHYRWGRIIDFLKLHYVLTQRTEALLARQSRSAEHSRSIEESAAALEISVAMVFRRVRPARGGVSGGQLSIRSLRHGVSHRGRTDGQRRHRPAG